MGGGRGDREKEEEKWPGLMEGREYVLKDSWWHGGGHAERKAQGQDREQHLHIWVVKSELHIPELSEQSQRFVKKKKKTPKEQIQVQREISSTPGTK